VKKEAQRAKQIINAALETIDLALRQLPHIDRTVIAAEAARRMITKSANSAQAIRQALEEEHEED
jgi:hypothetical protein